MKILYYNGHMKNKGVKRLVRISLIASIYVALTLFFAPISFLQLQFRISEVLMILPLFISDSIYGLTLGCFLSNLLGIMLGINSLGIIDVIIGPIATLLAALLTEKFKNIQFKGIPFLSIFMPVICNMLLIGLELDIVLFDMNISLLPLLMLQIGISEFVSCVMIGIVIYREINRRGIL